MSLHDTALPVRKSLRGKGMAVTLALLAYVLGAGVYLASERNNIDASIQDLDRLTRHEKALAITEAAVAGALVDVSAASNAETATPVEPSELRLYMEACTARFAALDEHDPAYALLQRAIARRYGELQASPQRANWIDLREALRRAADELDIRHRRLSAQREALNLAYQRHYDAVTVESLLLAVVGLVVFGSFAAWFFARLTHDIRLLEAHAGQIVRGTRGVTLEVRREDEVGRLMHAVNRMSADLDEREQQIRLDVEHRSHQDKMLAVGALAAGVAHEVNNPLAVIGGVAQELQAAGDAITAEQVAQGVRQILAQTQRAGQVARQLAEMAAPRPAELDWIDLNGLVRDAVRLIGYDRRYRRFEWDVAADASLPAVRSSGNAVQQVLTQMLSRACEAVAADPAAGARMRIETLAAEGGVAVRLLFPPVLDFSQAGVQRSLLLCRALVEPLRGRLALGQVDGPLQRIQLSLPADPGGETG